MSSRLLLVEDDAFTAELVRRALERADVATDVVACSGGEALERLRDMVRDGAAPDAVLLDLRPGGPGGLEVLAGVRSVPGLSPYPVIVYTGSTSAGDEAAALAAGADCFFVKPDEFGALVERMRDLGTRWLGAHAV